MRFSASELWEATVSDLSTTGHSRSQNGVLWTPMPVVHVEGQQAKRRWERRASKTSAWIAGSSPGNDERKDERKNERTEERTKMSEAKRRQTQGSCAVASATAAPLDGEAHIYRRSTAGLRPKESFIARDSASGQASWDVAGHVLRIL